MLDVGNKLLSLEDPLMTYKPKIGIVGAGMAGIAAG